MEKIKKTVIITGYNCNNRCLFCIDSNKRNVLQKSTKEIIYEMTEARKRGRTYLEIIGGEPTIRSDFIYLVKMSKKLGFKDIVMSTNGRMLAYKEYAKKLISAGITTIIFSIHGNNAKLHDYLTQTKGSFNQLLRGFKNLRELGFKNVGSNTTIVKQNYQSLPKIGNFIYKLGIRNAEFIFVDPSYGGAHNNFKKLVPRISDAAPYIQKCLDISKKKKLRHWHIRYVPLCYFLGYETQISELNEVRYFQTEHLAPDFKNYSVESSRANIGRIRVDRCRDCVYFDYCEGIWKEYVAHYGDGELKPQHIKGANSDLLGQDYVIKKIDIERINPFTKLHKDIFNNSRYSELKKSHLKAIKEIKEKIALGKKIKPIVVLENKNRTYRLEDGFCRYSAFKQLGFKVISCAVIKNEDNEELVSREMTDTVSKAIFSSFHNPSVKASQECHPTSPTIIGLVGFIAAGKSTVAEIIEEIVKKDVLIINTDDIVDYIVKNDKRTKSRLIDIFGAAITCRDRDINYKKLNKIVLLNEENFHKATMLICQKTSKSVLTLIEEAKKQHKKFIVIDGIWNYARFDDICNEIWLISVKERIRQQRVRLFRIPKGKNISVMDKYNKTIFKNFKKSPKAKIIENNDDMDNLRENVKKYLNQK